MKRITLPWTLGSIMFLGTISSLHGSPVSPLICANPGSTTASQTDPTINANSCTDFSYKYTNGVQSATGANNWLYGYYPGTSNPANFIPLTQQVTDSNGNYLGWWANNFTQYWTSLDAFGGHANGIYTDYHIPPFCDPTTLQNCSPNGGPDPRSPNSPDSANQQAVRRYVVPADISTTTVDISMMVQKDPRTTDPSAHGTVDYVILYHDGVATTLINLSDPVNFDPTLAGAPSTPSGIPQPVYTGTANNIVVHGGDYIDFVMSAATDPAENNQTVDWSSGTFQLDMIHSTNSNQSTPEPATFALAGAGLLLAGLMRRRLR
jgi:uncharacterized protein (TIGR03382 family)